MFLTAFPKKQRQLHINYYDVLRNMQRETMKVIKEPKCGVILTLSKSQNFSFSMKKMGLGL